MLLLAEKPIRSSLVPVRQLLQVVLAPIKSMLVRGLPQLLAGAVRTVLRRLMQIAIQQPIQSLAERGMILLQLAEVYLKLIAMMDRTPLLSII